jgi:hypothetical protein
MRRVLLPDLQERMADPEAREVIMDSAGPSSGRAS